MSRSAVRVVLGILVIFVLVVAMAGGFIWWKIAGLKEHLVQQLGNALGAHVEVQSLDLDFWKGELRAAGITLTNIRPSSPWEKGEIAQATVRFHLVDVLGQTLPLTVEVSSWSVVIHSYSASTEGSGDATSSAAPAASAEGRAPVETARHRIQVTQLAAQDGAVEIHLADNREVTLHGVSFDASNNGAGLWTTQLETASLTAGAFEAGESSVQIQGTVDKVTFSSLRLACGQGLVSGEGEVDLGEGHKAHATLKATDVPVTTLVAVEWQMKLSGLVTGDLTYDGNDQTGSAMGDITLKHAKFNVLPWLSKVTALVSLPDITDVEVDKATSDFAWSQRTLHLTNVDIRKNGVVRIGGAVDIDPTGQIDGKLKLGLPSSITSKFPPLQDQIFTVQLEDFNWADVHLTGTPDHLQEDLTSRLLAVGLQQGSGLLDQAAQKASDLYKSFMGK